MLSYIFLAGSIQVQQAQGWYENEGDEGIVSWIQCRLIPLNLLCLTPETSAMAPDRRRKDVEVCDWFGSAVFDILFKLTALMSPVESCLCVWILSHYQLNTPGQHTELSVSELNASELSNPGKTNSANLRNSRQRILKSTFLMFGNRLPSSLITLRKISILKIMSVARVS